MKPLSISDVTMAFGRRDLPDEWWYWCREHHRAESLHWAMVGCVRIGPFMDEAEAQCCEGLPRA